MKLGQLPVSMMEDYCKETVQHHATPAAAEEAQSEFLAAARDALQDAQIKDAYVEEEFEMIGQRPAIQDVRINCANEARHGIGFCHYGPLCRYMHNDDHIYRQKVYEQVEKQATKAKHIAAVRDGIEVDADGNLSGKPQLLTEWTCHSCNAANLRSSHICSNCHLYQNSQRGKEACKRMQEQIYLDPKGISKAVIASITTKDSNEDLVSDRMVARKLTIKWEIRKWKSA